MLLSKEISEKVNEELLRLKENKLIEKNKLNE